MSGYTACSPVYQGIILLILTVSAELFHLSGRIAGYSTCPTVCRDYTPLSDQSVTYFPWPTYSVYIDLLPISTTYYTQDTYSFFLDKFQIFPVCVPLPATANKKGNINVTCATCIDPSRVRALHSFRTRKPIHFYFEKGEEKTIPFTVNIKKKKKEEDGGCSWRRLFFTRYKNLLANVTLLPRYYGRKNIAYFFFFLTYIIVYFYQSKKKKKKKRILFLRFLDRYGSHV